MATLELQTSRQVVQATQLVKDGFTLSLTPREAAIVCEAIAVWPFRDQPQYNMDAAQSIYDILEPHFRGNGVSSRLDFYNDNRVVS